jgi:Asp-tRNA(Asn)/Glu-tRNA(Gln) amidotransferase A subunit family amidase
MAIQFAAPAWEEARLLSIAGRLEREGLRLPQDAPLPWL